ncbi:hypothetical protein HY642_00335 [Candidatus Woesearchaeota archaeon]|nr:hypothetical protein [Candidatus Woesearchaeota archaeon]
MGDAKAMPKHMRPLEVLLSSPSLRDLQFFAESAKLLHPNYAVVAPAQIIEGLAKDAVWTCEHALSFVANCWSTRDYFDGHLLLAEYLTLAGQIGHLVLFRPEAERIAQSDPRSLGASYLNLLYKDGLVDGIVRPSKAVEDRIEYWKSFTQMQHSA